MKYKVGDIVKVREDLKEASMIRDVYVTSDMEEFAGKLVTICQIDIDNCLYYIEEDDERHFWISEFFEDDEEDGDEEDGDGDADKIRKDEKKSDEYEDIIDKVLSEMTEETKNTLIKQLIKGENTIAIIATPIYKMMSYTNGVSIQKIIGTKYGVTITNKEGTIKL